jgi:hypothetical protein
LPPDPPPGGKGAAAAIEADSVATFARDLRLLRANAGLDYPAMAEKSHYTMRTLASAAGGLRLPTLPVLIAYVQACGSDVAEWEDRWAKLGKSKTGAAAALPAAGGDVAKGSAGGSPVDGVAPGAPRAPGAPGAPGGHAHDGRSGDRPGAGGVNAQSQQRSNEVYVITSAPPRDAHW